MVKLTKQSEIELHEAGCRSDANDEYRSSTGLVPFWSGYLPKSMKFNVNKNINRNGRKMLSDTIKKFKNFEIKNLKML